MRKLLAPKMVACTKCTNEKMNFEKKLGCIMIFLDVNCYKNKGVYIFRQFRLLLLQINILRSFRLANIFSVIWGHQSD